MKDLFSGHSREYALYRPNYPDALFSYLLDHCPGRDLAWDVATGNGQVARHLAQYFALVIGTDISRNQLSEAPELPNISYRMEQASVSSHANGSVDLVTVAQAIHWFDLEEFEREVLRVLKPDGVFAYWGYSLPCVEDKRINGMLQDFYEMTDPYWEPERELVDSSYALIDFSGFRRHHKNFEFRDTWPAERLVSYLDTWSGLRNMRIKTKSDPLLGFSEALGDGSQMLTIEFPIFLFVCERMRRIPLSG